MKIKHLKGTTASALTTNYLTLTNSLVVFAASSGQVQSGLTQAANTIQSILTGLVVLTGIYVALLIITRRMPDMDDPREKSGVYHAVDRVAGLVALAVVVIWSLPWVCSLFTQNQRGLLE